MAYENTKAKITYINKVGEEEKVMRKRIRRYNMEISARPDLLQKI